MKTIAATLTLFTVLCLVAAPAAAKESVQQKQKKAAAVVEKLLTERRADFNRCFASRKTGRQEILLRFDVEPRGKAANITVTAPDYDTATLTRCLSRHVKAIHFPKEASFLTFEHKFQVVDSAGDKPQAR